MMAVLYEWTDERINEMFQLWRDGLSHSEIARKLHVTKNTICGKLYREKLRRGLIEPKPRTLKEKVERQAKKPEPTLPKSATLMLTKAKHKPVAVPCEGQLASIIDVTGCRWPVKDDRAFIGGVGFCNHATDEKQSYCPYHAQMNVASYSKKLISRTMRAAWHAYTRKVAA